MRTLPRLHLVTDDGVLADPVFPDMLERVLECCGAIAALHVRGHETSGARITAAADAASAAALRHGAWLLVNDRIDVALAVRANGVLLGARSLAVSDARALLGAGAPIGSSVHAAAEAVQAEVEGADWLMLGTIWETVSHPGRAGAGASLVRNIAALTALPVIAIGGVTPARVKEAAAAGAHGVAVLGGIWRAADPVAAAAEYAGSVRRAWPADSGVE